jgi:signal transduction histidine kinase
VRRAWGRGGHGFWRGFHASLFLKVLLVLGLCGALLNGLFALSWRLGRVEQGEDGRGSRLHRGEMFIRKYVSYVLSDLGEPVDRAKARQLADEGTWKIRFVPAPGSAQAAWATGEDVPAPEELLRWKKGDDWGWRRGSFFVLHPSQGGTLVLFAEPFRGLNLAWPWRIALACGVVLILLLAWAAMRWLLLPIRWLDQGMARVAAGDLGHRVPTRPGDELGRLGEQFNTMTARVQAMLQQRQQLLLDVSHELRTPLTRLKLGLEALPEGADRAGLAEDIAELEALVAELLEGARLEAGASALKLEDLDLSALVLEAAHGFTHREPGLQVKVPPGVRWTGDRTRLERLILNLLNNAFTHGQPARAPVLLKLESHGQGSQVVLTVADQGPGLAPAEKERLFTPFFRADASRTRATGGLGLGLLLCQRIANAHGGALQVQTAPGQGFSVVLSLSR